MVNVADYRLQVFERCVTVQAFRCSGDLKVRTRLNPQTAGPAAFKNYTVFEKKFEEQRGIEYVIISKRRFQYEKEFKIRDHTIFYEIFKQMIWEFITDAGWEEYYDYIFPEDAANQPKLLSMAHMWKKQQQQDQDQEKQEAEKDESTEPTQPRDEQEESRETQETIENVPDVRDDSDSSSSESESETKY
ncbi:crooked neck-like protein 1 [Silurus meridionalis]|nr:crooked neck-like protein 1 [Silurus meridionalis]